MILNWKNILSIGLYKIFQRFNSFSAGIVFIRQNLTSVDVRFCRIKKIPALQKSKYIKWPYSLTHNIGIQMKRKELSKTFMLISNLRSFLVFIKYISALRVDDLSGLIFDYHTWCSRSTVVTLCRSVLRGLVNLKKIKKSEKNSDCPDNNHPPRLSNFFGNMYSNKKNTKTQKKQNFNKKNPSRGWIHTPTSGFFSDFWIFFTVPKPVQLSRPTVTARIQRVPTVSNVIAGYDDWLRSSQQTW